MGLEDMRRALENRKKPPILPPPRKIVPPQGGTPPPNPKNPKGFRGPQPGQGIKKEKKPPKPKSWMPYRCKHKCVLKEIEHMDCPLCRAKSKAAHKRAENAKKLAYPRLPIGTSKVVIWDGTVWKGKMLVPGGDIPVFDAETKTERECFHELHRAYVHYLRAQETPTTPTPAETPDAATSSVLGEAPCPPSGEVRQEDGAGDLPPMQ